MPITTAADGSFFFFFFFFFYLFIYLFILFFKENKFDIYFNRLLQTIYMKKQDLCFNKE